VTTKLSVKVIPITRMDCPTCIPVLERKVKQLDGVDEVRGNYMNKTLKVTYNSNMIQLADIEATIERLGYRIAYKKYPRVISSSEAFSEGRKLTVFSLSQISTSQEESSMPPNLSQSSFHHQIVRYVSFSKNNSRR